MVIDTFLFRDEVELLEIRLNELRPVVDKFLIVEAQRTFSGCSRMLVFPQHKSLFEKFADRIIYWPIAELGDNPDPWERQSFQRREINHALQAFGLASLCANDAVLLSDVDEIPSCIAVQQALQQNASIVVIWMKTYWYFVNVLCLNDTPWPGTVIVRGDQLKSMDQVRRLRPPEPPANFHFGGWHFSYQGGAGRVRKKMLAISDPCTKSIELTSPAALTENISKRTDILNRGYQFKQVAFDNSFPSCLVSNRQRFSPLIAT